MKYISILLTFILIFTGCNTQTVNSRSEKQIITYERINGNNSLGYIDNFGDTIIPLGKYKFLNPIDKEGMIFAQLNNKYGFIDINQNVLILSTFFL